MLTRIAFLLIAATLSVHAQPSWIWSSAKPQGNAAQLRKTISIAAAPKSATLIVTCDNGAKVSLNGKQVIDNPDWQEPTKADVKAALKVGENTITVHATNKGGTAGFFAKLTIENADGTKTEITTDDTWEAAPEKSDAWAKATLVGAYGKGPWGDILAGGARKGGSDTVSSPEDIVALPGFKVEMLYNVPKAEQGSWVALTVDPKGDLIASDQQGGLYRIKPAAIGAKEPSTVTKLAAKIEGAHGLLYAFNALYVMVNERKPAGLYRLKDKGDGTFADPELLREMKGGGEHGPHSVILSPDGKSLYINAGNHTKTPENMEGSRSVQAWQEDHIIERMWDANGHAKGILAPGGYVCETDPDGKNMKLFCMGFRNEFDIAFDANGELFTFDADMEWDIGSPWYRPTRVNHCVSGGEYGWRSGSGKWPAYYIDSLPATQDIGPGSPTGIVFGTGAKFPAKYQRALFINDWTYGTMYAIHHEPSGGSFKAVKEEFVSGRPLPLTDVIIRPQDGAMYFAVGGRKTQSGLYRVTYEGKESTAAAEPYTVTAEAKERHALEALHVDGASAEAIAKIWPKLSSPDRHVRFAARVAIERQPVAQWLPKLEAEKNTDAVLEGLVAVAHVGGKELRDEALEKLGTLEDVKLTHIQKLAVIRVLDLIVLRLGKPEGKLLADIISALEGEFPTTSNDLNRELCQTLVALGSTSVVSKTIQLMATTKDDHEDIADDALLNRNIGYAKAASDVHNSRPNRQQIWYAYCLRVATAGWTPELHKAYFSWFPRTGVWKGGNSFRGFLNNMRTQALGNVADATERATLDTMSAKLEVPAIAANITLPKGPGRNWTLNEVLALMPEGRASLKGRDFERGKSMFIATACATCHRFAGDGGSVGPDITGAGSRYTMRDFMENIIDPSKIISDQYESSEIKKKDGSTVIGRVIVEENGKTMVSINPFAPQDMLAIDSGDIASKKPYAISMMPPGMIKVLSQDELLDLVAYVMSGGDAKDKAFTK